MTCLCPGHSFPLTQILSTLKIQTQVTLWKELLHKEIDSEISDLVWAAFLEFSQVSITLAGLGFGPQAVGSEIILSTNHPQEWAHRSQALTTTFKITIFPK